MNFRPKLFKKSQTAPSDRDPGENRSSELRIWFEKLLTRTSTGAVYVAVLLLCVVLSRLSTALLAAAFSWLGCSEFFRIMRMAGKRPFEPLGLAAAVVFPLTALFPFRYFLLVCFIFLWICVLWYVFSLHISIVDVCVTVFGALYTGVLMSSLVLLKKADPSYFHSLLTVGVLASIWANDGFAFLVGSRLGRHKLAPKISPHKSWEGLLGGLLASVIFWIFLRALVFPHAELISFIIFGLISGLCCVVGDLFESRIKRSVGIKDSGRFIPGHGGLLDRMDSQLFACTVSYIMLLFGGFL